MRNSGITIKLERNRPDNFIFIFWASHPPLAALEMCLNLIGFIRPLALNAERDGGGGG